MTANSFHMAAVMGYPVMHSRSPLMHNYWMRQQGLSGTYVPIEVRPGTLEGALRGLHPLRFAGCNLTIPHKLDALRIVDAIDDVAARIGAISCVVVRQDASLFGTNNDWRGFLDNLRSSAPDWRADAGPAVVMGGGGGARAVCYGLLSAGVRELRLVNRTAAHAERIRDDLGGPITIVPWSERRGALEGVATLVNATSLGMVGQPPLDINLAALPLSAVVCDIVYAPLETPLLGMARGRGNIAVDGLGMLLHQGPPAWQLWFGVMPEVTAELRTLMVQNLTA
jgi:shikimate dehydrogenase